MKIEIHKASAIAQRDVESLTVVARESFPDFTTQDYALGRARELHVQNAEKLGNALVSCLPGGTIDQLLIFLLKYRASELVVPFGK